MDRVGSVRIEYAPHSGLLTLTCRCGWRASVPIGTSPGDPPEKEDWAIDRALPEALTTATEHNEKGHDDGLA
ncbi:hypothetical protein [Streptomyces sp. NPDC054784]